MWLGQPLLYYYTIGGDCDSKKSCGSSKRRHTKGYSRLLSRLLGGMTLIQKRERAAIILWKKNHPLYAVHTIFIQRTQFSMCWYEHSIQKSFFSTAAAAAPSLKQMMIWGRKSESVSQFILLLFSGESLTALDISTLYAQYTKQSAASSNLQKPKGVSFKQKKSQFHENTCNVDKIYERTVML